MEIGFDWSDLTDLLHVWQAPDLKPVAQGMQMALTDLANTWEGAASGVRLPGMTRTVHDPRYAASIDYRQAGQLEGTVGSSDPLLDARAQEAAPGWDMKPGLLHGPKSRTTRPKRGQAVHRFNIIPIRHRAETVSHEALLALIQNVAHFVPREPMPRMAKITPLGVYVHQAALEAGIRLGRNGPVTFRTVSDRSPAAAWWYPARLANPIADAVWNLLADAVTDDLLAAWAAALGVADDPTR